MPFWNIGDWYQVDNFKILDGAVKNSYDLTQLIGTFDTNDRPRFVGWPSIPFSPKSEKYYVQVPHTAGPRSVANKIRIEDWLFYERYPVFIPVVCIRQTIHISKWQLHYRNGKFWGQACIVWCPNEPCPE